MISSLHGGEKAPSLQRLTDSNMRLMGVGFLPAAKPLSLSPAWRQILATAGVHIVDLK
jgi:hypothetical protein